MKNKYRILKIVITVIILGFLLSFSLKSFSNQKITDNKVSVKLNGEGTPVYFVDEKSIKEMVQKENPSRRVGDINIPELEKKIRDIHSVDSANVYLNLNGHLNLDIKQRVPAFRLVNGEKDFYVDAKGAEFAISKNYSHPCMLVTGDVKKSEYQDLAKLIQFIDQDEFSMKYFIGIAKDKQGYNLLTSEGNYKVEIGDLDRIEFKIKGFKTFVEKILVSEDPQKYNKISVKYDNQIVTTLNPYFKGNDSIINVGKKELAKTPDITRSIAETKKPILTSAAKPVVKPSAKPEKKVEKKKESKDPIKKTEKKTEKSKNTAKPKAKVKVE